MSPAIKEEVYCELSGGAAGAEAFVYLLVLNIFSDLVDYFLEAHWLHDVAHHIALADERCRLRLEVRAVRLHYNCLHLALGMGLSLCAIVGAFLLWLLSLSFGRGGYRRFRLTLPTASLADAICTA